MNREEVHSIDGGERLDVAFPPTEDQVVAAGTPMHVSDQQGSLDVELISENVGTILPND